MSVSIVIKCLAGKIKYSGVAKLHGALLVISVVFVSCTNSAKQEQNTAPPESRLLGTCEGCEAVFEFGDRQPGPVDTLPDFGKGGSQIKVTGIIYEADARTPAKDVILYIYHTDSKGRYTPGPDPKGWERRHGYNRGWVKTRADGRYTFYTVKPGTYPDFSEPAHIHAFILEPDGSYYWIESYYFTGDPLLSMKQTYPERPRGGTTGVLALREHDGILVGQRDIILRRNVPK